MKVITSPCFTSASFATFVAVPSTSFVAVTVYSPSVAVTVIVAVAVFVLSTVEVTVMVASPAFTPVTVPSSVTVAIVSSLVVHFTASYPVPEPSTVAVNFAVAPTATVAVSGATEIPVTFASSIGFTSGAFGAPSVLTASGSNASISLISPLPIIVAGSEFLEVTVILSTFAPSGTSIVAAALSSTVTSDTVAVPSKVTVAFTLPPTATLVTLAPSCTVTVALPVTVTVPTVASPSTVISLSAVTVVTEPFATSTGALASRIPVLKPTILVATSAINVLIVFSASSVVSVKISTGFALVTPSFTVTLSINFVPLVNVMVNLSSAILLFAAATTASSPM